MNSNKRPPEKSVSTKQKKSAAKVVNPLGHPIDGTGRKKAEEVVYEVEYQTHGARRKNKLSFITMARWEVIL